MFDSQQRSTGTEHTSTVALLVVAFILSSALLVGSRPNGYLAISLAVACSAVCLGLAWFNWKNRSNLTIPCIAKQASSAR
jgi:UDP-N-acetylmuramyl pentapeptide phosphotransferase/UDP-N-acetylglucosamine-1-phosphate transferase